MIRQRLLRKRSGASFWLCLVALMVACTLPTPTPEYSLPDFSAASHDCISPFEGEQKNTPQGSLGEGYFTDQVILTGEPDGIQQVLDNFPEFQGGEVLIDPLPPEFVQQTGLDVRLYEVDFTLGANQTNSQLIESINNDAAANAWLALAEPNYITRLPVGATGSGDGGSGISGDPDKNMAPAPYGADRFIRQWAFSGPASIRLFDDSNPHKWTPGSYTGQGVRVVVFDTTPLPEGSRNIDWARVPFQLCVLQPGLRFIDQRPEPIDNISRVPKAEHGLFVAGLAHGIAPESEYYLIEVLNSEARGDVYSLVRAIALYLTDPTMESYNGKTVFNLSLGLEVLHERVLSSEVQAVIDSLLQNINSNFLADPRLIDLIDQFPVTSLKLALEMADEKEVVVVAAAGNDGVDHQQVPASFSQVLGVASTKSDGAETCFTNLGDVAAPSGDGDSNCMEETPILCPDGTRECQSAVISTVTKTQVPSGHAYWTGTSFSAPMASGLAALIRGAKPGATPQQIIEAIRDCGVTPITDLPTALAAIEKRGTGIINVENTIKNCLP